MVVVVDLHGGGFLPWWWLMMVVDHHGGGDLPASWWFTAMGVVVDHHGGLHLWGFLCLFMDILLVQQHHPY